MARQSRQQIKDPRRIRLVHLRSKLALECLPRLLALRSLGEGHQLLARRQVRQPDIVEVPPREFRLRDSARRTANRANPYTFIWLPGRSKPHHCYRQVQILPRVLEPMARMVRVSQALRMRWASFCSCAASSKPASFFHRRESPFLIEQSR